MAINATYPRFKAFDANGDPLSGGLLYTYLAGTSTKRTTFQDIAQTTPHTNPIILDSNGEALIYLASGEYKFVLNNPNPTPPETPDDIVWTVDDIASLTYASYLTSKTENYTLANNDLSGHWTFSNQGATGEVVLTLPQGQADYSVSFIVTAAYNLKVAATNNERFRWQRLQGAQNGYVESDEIGTAWTIRWSGTEWVITTLAGTLGADGTTEWFLLPIPATGDHGKVPMVNVAEDWYVLGALSPYGQNLLHNSAFRINQRNNYISAVNQHIADRWLAYIDGTVTSMYGLPAQAVLPEDAAIYQKSKSYLFIRKTTGTSNTLIRAYQVDADPWKYAGRTVTFSGMYRVTGQVANGDELIRVSVLIRATSGGTDEWAVASVAATVDGTWRPFSVTVDASSIPSSIITTGFSSVRIELNSALGIDDGCVLGLACLKAEVGDTATPWVDEGVSRAWLDCLPYCWTPVKNDGVAEADWFIPGICRIAGEAIFRFVAPVPMITSTPALTISAATDFQVQYSSWAQLSGLTFDTGQPDNNSAFTLKGTCSGPAAGTAVMLGRYTNAPLIRFSSGW